ncbi:MAG: hypothetical protein ACRCTE_08175 [Cellulosilyticaceae bacterium]
MEKKKWTKCILVAVVLFFILTGTIHANEWYEESLKVVLEEIKEQTGMTSQIDILGVKYENEEVTINLSKDLLSYGGGTYTEYIIGTRLMEWAFTETHAKVMKLEVEGDTVPLPEGSDYSFCTKQSYELYYLEP